MSDVSTIGILVVVGGGSRYILGGSGLPIPRATSTEADRGADRSAFFLVDSVVAYL